VLESTSSASVSPGCARNTAHACERLSCWAPGAWSRPACAGAVARAGTPLAAAASGVPPGFFELGAGAGAPADGRGAGAGAGPPGAARADSLESAGAPAGVPAGFFEVRRSEVHACGGGGRVHLAPTPSTPSCMAMLPRAQRGAPAAAAAPLLQRRRARRPAQAAARVHCCSLQPACRRHAETLEHHQQQRESGADGAGAAGAGGGCSAP